MNGFLEDILSAEAEGRRLAAAARERAALIIYEARRQALALTAAAKESGRLEAERVSAALLEAGAREKAERLAAAGAEIEDSLRPEEGELLRLADEVVRRVLKTE
jgi:vacuolar-type H+-ATPase subunit H